LDAAEPLDASAHVQSRIEEGGQQQQHHQRNRLHEQCQSLNGPIKHEKQADQCGQNH
jgi:hypothetical protein